MDVIVFEGSCAWMQGGQSWGRYSGSDTPKGDIDADLYSIGLQREFAEGWFVGGVLGRMTSDINAREFRGDGHTNMGGIGLKHESGRWLMGASLAYAKGSYDSARRFVLPMLSSTRSAPDAPMARRARTTPSRRTSKSACSAAWARRRSCAPTWMRACGSHPGADREIAFQVAGANSANGWFRNTIDEPLATGTLKVGAQLFREDALDLRLEYGLAANGDFRNQSATARLGWNF